MSLAGSKTEQNLKAAFARESEANRRFLYFARKADSEGHIDVAAMLRAAADDETGHALGHLEFLEETGDPASGLPMDSIEDSLRAAIASEVSDSEDMYPAMAREARAEGFDDVADWFETLARADRSHSAKFQTSLDAISGTTAR